MSQTITHHVAAPAFLQIVAAVRRQNPLQAKRLDAFLAGQDAAYWEFAEDVSALLHRTLITRPEDRDAIARAYNDLCMTMVRDQIAFRKTGVYPVADADRARREVYDQPEVMWRYMVGLLVSQMLWPNHYLLFRFFRTTVRDARPTRYLEVGAGHGLFVREALRQCPGLDAEVCDISAAAIVLSQRILSALDVRVADVRFTHRDFSAYTTDQPFDFLTAGEVLEHVHDPVAFLTHARGLLAPRGTMYLSTCVNCPAVDHVYHFHDVEEIRTVIARAGLIISDEFVLPAEDVPCSQWAEQRVTVNYGAKLRLTVR